MRRLSEWLLGVVGVVLSLAGVAAAVLVGPDDAIAATSEHVDSAGAAIVTGPGVIEYAGPTLTLVASSPDGPVFVGVGSRVDVADFVSDVSHTQIDQIDQISGLQESFIKGSEDVLVPGPGLDWWLHSATGERAVVEFALPDQPVSVVVMNVDGASPVVVDLTADVAIPGAFWGAIAAALIGVGLLLVAIVTLRRRRPRREPEDTESIEVT